MGTRTITPRTHNDGQIGSSSKYWNKGYFNELNINTLNGISSIGFEGSAPDDFETTLSITNPTADRNIVFPDASGTVAFTSDVAITSIGTDGANRVLTSDGDGTLTAESTLQYSSDKLSFVGPRNLFIDSGTDTGIDVISSCYGQINFDAHSIGGAGTGGLIQMQDQSTGTNTGCDLGIKAGGAYGSNRDGGGIHLIAGRGTGTGDGGSLKFYSSPNGSTGGSYNTSAEVFSVDHMGKTNVKTLELESRKAEFTGEGQFVPKQKKITLDQAACNNLNSSPQTLVASYGASSMIIPISVTVFVDRNSADTSNADLIVGYNGATSFTYAIKYLRRFMSGITTDMTFVMSDYLGKAANSLTGAVDQNLTIATSTGISNNSLTSMTIYVGYYAINTT